MKKKEDNLNGANKKEETEKTNPKFKIITGNSFERTTSEGYVVKINKDILLKEKSRLQNRLDEINEDLYQIELISKEIADKKSKLHKN